MAKDIDAVLGSLRVVLQDLNARSDLHVKVLKINRWIDQLPGLWWRWRNLRLTGDYGGEVLRRDAIDHLRATITYLEINRDQIKSLKPWWPFSRARSAPQPSEPIEAEFADVSEPPDANQSLRLVKKSKN